MEKKIDVLHNLGFELKNISNEIKNNIFLRNNWFTIENVNFSLDYWSKTLEKKNVKKWVSNYIFDTRDKNLGIICAGNIPLVGLHDVICGYLSGYNLKIKLSSQDDILMKIVIEYLINNRSEEKIQIVDFLKDIDLVIATGSNNTFRYFEYYFRDICSILRKNRTSIAILNGEEKDEELGGFADDFFTYFGRGCRNISKVFLPKGYDLDKIFRAFYRYSYIDNNNKYKNNYDYNRAMYILEKIPFLENGFFMMKEDESLFSPISVLYYQYYNDISEVKDFIKKNEQNIQCIVSNILDGSVNFGESQTPKIYDYADNSDTLAFLK